MNADSLKERIASYAKGKGLELITKLGEGQDGLVWASDYTAIKCLVNKTNYERELGCYQHLDNMGITELMGFSIPRAETIPPPTYVQPIVSVVFSSVGFKTDFQLKIFRS